MDPILFELKFNLRFNWRRLKEGEIFLVHGHDESTKFEAKNYLQNCLRLPEPVVLHEQPSRGRTVIEKLEDCSKKARLVFVLLTADDLVATSGTQREVDKRRARQNVIFEMGYFLGRLGRRRGRVLLLYRGEIELPSDISGIIFIDISQGVAAAGEEIRRELEDLI